MRNAAPPPDTDVPRNDSSAGDLLSCPPECPPQARWGTFPRSGGQPAHTPSPRPSCSIGLRYSDSVHSEAILEYGGRQSWGRRSRPRSDPCRKAALDVFSILWVPVACLQSWVSVLAEKIGSLFLGWMAGHPFWQLPGIRFPSRISVTHGTAPLQNGHLHHGRDRQERCSALPSSQIPGLLSLSPDQSARLGKARAWAPAGWGPCLGTPARHRGRCWATWRLFILNLTTESNFSDHARFPCCLGGPEDTHCCSPVSWAFFRVRLFFYFTISNSLSN